ncbi:MAG: hypothetical protein ACRD04_06000 [Terriglobales bacterium]
MYERPRLCDLPERGTTGRVWWKIVGLIEDAVMIARRLASSHDRQASALERIALELNRANDRAELRAAEAPKQRG